MHIRKKLRIASVCSSSALIAMLTPLAHAYEFEVGESTVAIYGYAKLDLIYDTDADMGNSVSYSKIRLDGEKGGDGHANLHAYESRFGFSTRTMVAGSMLRTQVEADFLGSNNNLRLRHAFGEWKGVLAGQTWMNFHGHVAGTTTIDSTGVGGRPRNHRQAQLRYTTNNFSVAIEDPDDKGGTPDALGEKSRLPDVTVRYTDISGPFKYSVSGVARYLEYDSAGLETPSDKDSVAGWGIGLEAAYDITNALTIRGGLTHGKGIGSYIHSNPGAPAYVNAEGDLEAIKATGFTVGTSFKVGTGAFNAAYSRASADLDDNPTYIGGGTLDAPGADDLYESVWVNYIWSPIKQINYGVEAGWHSRETAGGFEGDAIRLQGMVKYIF